MLTLAKVPCELRSQASPLYIHRKLLAWIRSGEAYNEVVFCRSGEATGLHLLVRNPDFVSCQQIHPPIPTRACLQARHVISCHEATRNIIHCHLIFNFPESLESLILLRLSDNDAVHSL